MLSEDPTISLSEDADAANGPTPNPPTRYGQPLPKEWIPLYRKPMRTPTRKLRVVTIGAGISAMNLAYKIHHEQRLIDAGIVDSLCMYEANEDLGGTWLVNTYPGVACDVPAHIYTFPFEPNPDWSAFYAGGGEIWEYLKRTVEKWGLDRDVRCGHRVQRAEFDEERGKWKLEVKNKDGVFEDECDILVSAVGFLSNWRWPDIEGIETFAGHKCHSAVWDKDFDWTGMRIGVIGNGSSAIQILPQVVEKAEHVTSFQRNKTYITPGLGSSMIGGEVQYYYSEEEKRKFRENPEELKKYRKEIQAGSNRAFDMFTKGSKAQIAGKKATADQMKAKLSNDEELAKRLIPDYEVGCRRATPGPGYLEAFTRDDVSLVTERIEKIEPKGIRTSGGTLYECDAIVCATGFNVSHQPPWPLIGRGGLTLAEAWKDEPTAYLSLCASKFPNFFMFSGRKSPLQTTSAYLLC